MSLTEREILMSRSAEFVNSHTKPIKIIFFGSIVTDKFDADSDIDLLAIYQTQNEADAARRVLYSTLQPTLDHPLEMICIDEATFEKKSAVGGIYFVAQAEGKIWG